MTVYWIRRGNMGKGFMTKSRGNHNDFLLVISGTRPVPDTHVTQLTI
jgi:hypothetical protein